MITNLERKISADLKQKIAAQEIKVEANPVKAQPLIQPVAIGLELEFEEYVDRQRKRICSQEEKERQKQLIIQARLKKVSEKVSPDFLEHERSRPLYGNF